MITTVLVPADESEDSLRALKPAKALADKLSADLIVTTVVLQAADQLPRRRQLRERIAKLGVPVHSVTASVNGYFVDGGLAPYLDRDDVAVVAATAGHSRSVMISGSITERMLHKHPHLTMVLVGPKVNVDRYQVGGPLFASVDPSSESEAIIEPVGRLSKQLKLVPWVLTVLDPTPISALRTSIDGPDPGMESSRVHAVANRLRAMGVGEVNWDVLHDKNPSRSIADFAAGYDPTLIAVATRERSGLSRMAWGSVAIDTVKNATCPVLAVHAENG